MRPMAGLKAVSPCQTTRPSGKSSRPTGTGSPHARPSFETQVKVFARPPYSGSGSGELGYGRNPAADTINRPSGVVVNVGANRPRLGVGDLITATASHALPSFEVSTRTAPPG